MKRLTLLIACLLFMGLNVLWAQVTQVSGTITSSDDGQPLPGVSVMVKGTTIGITTNIDGKYTLDIPADATTLVVKFVGMATQELPITGSTLDVVLQPEVTALNEVVVTALGVTKNVKSLGYEVQNVSSEEIAYSGNQNMINSLSGRVSGVRVNSSAGTAGASSMIEIRGSSSILGENRPLFVVDGVPVDGGGGDYSVDGVATSDRIGDLNPDDIESMTVLKGGAATALYGIRAGNGAIIITTKKGKAGEGKKMNVDVSSSVSFEQISQVPGLQNKYSQGSVEYANYFTDAYGTEFSQIAYPDGQVYKQVSWGPALNQLSYTTNPTFIPVDDGMRNVQYESMDSYIARWDPNGRVVLASDPLANGQAVNAYDPYDFFQTGITYNNSIALSGGNENTTYYFSYGNYNQEGVIPNNTLVKNTFKVSAETKLNAKIKTGVDINYLNNFGNKIQQGSNISGVMLGLLRTPPTFDNSYGYQFDDGLQRTFRGGGGYDNPYWVANNISFKDNLDRILGNVHINYNATSWLNISYRLGTDWYNYRYHDYFEKYSNAFPTGRVRASQLYSQDINSDLLVNINKDIVSGINLNLTLGHNMYQSKWSRITGVASGVDMLDWNSINNSGSVLAFETNYKKRTAALFYDLTLSWKNLVVLNTTGRNEWSTTLPEGDNSFFAPSVSAAFNFTELEAFSGIKDVLSYGKLRASYAIVANDADAYLTSPYYYQDAPADGWTTGLSFPFAGSNGYAVGNTLWNDNIKPEKEKNLEFGLDLRFYNDRITLDMAYYMINNEELLLAAPIAASSGYDAYYTNSASMETKGLDILLGLVPVKSQSFKWEIIANFSNPQTEVTELAPALQNVNGVSLNVGFVDPQVHAIVGEPYRSIWGTQWLYDADGNLIIDPTTGYPVQDAQNGLLGNVQEDWRLGLMNTFTVFNFTLSALLEIKQGGEMWNGTKGALYYFGTHEDTEGRETDTKTWTGVYGTMDDDGNVVYLDAAGDPSATAVANDQEISLDENWYFWSGPGSGFTGPAEPFMEETDWVRLRELTLSYKFGKVLDKTFIDNVELYFSGRNLWISTPYTGVDPETSLFGTNNAQGIDYFNMPGTKSYSFGLKLTF